MNLADFLDSQSISLETLPSADRRDLLRKWKARFGVSGKGFPSWAKLERAGTLHSKYYGQRACNEVEAIRPSEFYITAEGGFFRRCNSEEPVGAGFPIGLRDLSLEVVVWDVDFGWTLAVDHNRNMLCVVVTGPGS